MKSLPIDVLILIGFFASTLIILISGMNWRRAIHAALVVALFEGAIRKWILPQASELVYFLKDIILLGAYFKFFLSPDTDIRRWRLDAPAGLVIMISCMVVLTGAFNTNIGSPVLAAYGVKVYLWYLPLGFMMPYLFRSDKEMANTLFIYSLISIPICLLGIAQFFAGPDSWINVYAKSQFAEMNQVSTFGGGSERARITGTFSYITGHSTFVVFFFALCLGLLSGLKDKRRWVILVVILPLLAANALMSGSRGAVFTMILMGAFFTLVSIFKKVGTGRNVIPYIVLAGAVIMIGVSSFLGSAVKEFENRRKTADDSVTGRALTPFATVVTAASEVGMAGYGIGMSHPALEAMRTTLKVPAPRLRCPVYDSEMGQVLAELGFVGFVMWYLLRIMMLLTCWEAFSKAPPSMFQSLALVFFCYHAINISGSMVLNHTANLFICASWGFCMMPRLKLLIGSRRPQVQTKSIAQSLKPNLATNRK
jgi:hypothetical protein